MQPQAAAVPFAQLDRLAEHYAEQPWTAAVGLGGDREGAGLAMHGVPERGIPACASCHGPPPRHDRYPRIAGQDAGFIARQLTLFRDGARGGTTYGHVMPVFAGRLSDRQIAAVAAFYAGPADH